VAAVVEQNRAAWLKLVFVDDRKDGHVKFNTLVRGYDRVGVVDDLLEIAYAERGAT
jgi:hypothetical protein